MVKAARTETNRMIKLSSDMPAMGPTSHQTTDSYTDNQQLEWKNKFERNVKMDHSERLRVRCTHNMLFPYSYDRTPTERPTTMAGAP